MPTIPKLSEVGTAFLKLGFISFGGPIAHLGYFRKEFVEKRRWLDDAAYADMVALCQFLPGPASSQVAFSLGMLRAGPAGGLLASVAFMLPSAAAMIGFAHGVASLGDMNRAGWLHGLMLAAVAVVALAVWQMGRRLCTDGTRCALAAASVALVLAVPGPLFQIVAIAVCAAIAAWLRLGIPTPADSGHSQTGSARAWGAAALGLFGTLLVGLPILAAVIPTKAVGVFDGFYRSGSLVFGGGHVVLPLLRSEFVPRGWISDKAFLAGYGAVQAVPGPLFTFAGYLGTAMDGGPHAWVGGVLGLLALYLPGWLLVAGVLPFWHALRGKRWARSAMAGANAAVVGILLAALYRPVCTGAIHDARDGVAAGAALVLIALLKLPPWALVAAMAAAGQWILR